MNRSKLLIFAGPSGAGKSTLMREVSKLDDRFQYVRAYMTRPLREGEKEKIYVSDTEMTAMFKRGELININALHGYKYGPSAADIRTKLASGQFPMIDWAPDRVAQLTTLFPNQTFVVFVQPPSPEILDQRLRAMNREDRIPEARAHLERLAKGDYQFDALVTSEEGTVEETARRVLQSVT